MWQPQYLAAEGSGANDLEYTKHLEQGPGPRKRCLSTAIINPYLTDTYERPTMCWASVGHWDVGIKSAPWACRSAAAETKEMEGEGSGTPPWG